MRRHHRKGLEHVTRSLFLATAILPKVAAEGPSKGTLRAIGLLAILLRGPGGEC